MTKIGHQYAKRGAQLERPSVGARVRVAEMHQDLGMGEGRAWMRAHGAGGRRRAWKGSYCKGEQ